MDIERFVRSGGQLSVRVPRVGLCYVTVDEARLYFSDPDALFARLCYMKKDEYLYLVREQEEIELDVRYPRYGSAVRIRCGAITKFGRRCRKITDLYTGVDEWLANYRGGNVARCSIHDPE